MSKKLRVLIVEDSEDDAQLLLRELRSGGYKLEFERVATREAIADALKRQAWDVITCDYSMPQFNGLEALKLLRKSGLDIPCIIVSGKIGEDTAVQLMKAGANDYVMKGNLKRLAPAIERELGETEVRRERKRAEDKLQTAYARLEKQSAILAQEAKMSAIGVLVAGVAHELNNPLMAMLHFAQYCLKHTAEDDRSYRVLQDIEHETRRCIDIVKNLLTFSHSGDRKKERYEIENPAEILERVVRLLSYRIEKEGVSITSHVDEETPKIRMQVNAMQNVLLNLLTNALDALEESKKKEVRIDVHPDGDGVRFSIADSGIGISPEVIGNIYDPFFTTKPVGKGTGLGLSLCHGIIHAHDGQITCESEPGKGTVFHVFIPTNIRKGAKRDEAHFSDRRR